MSSKREFRPLPLPRRLLSQTSHIARRILSVLTENSLCVADRTIQGAAGLDTSVKLFQSREKMSSVGALRVNPWRKFCQAFVMNTGKLCFLVKTYNMWSQIFLVMGKGMRGESSSCARASLGIETMMRTAFSASILLNWDTLILLLEEILNCSCELCNFKRSFREAVQHERRWTEKENCSETPLRLTWKIVAKASGRGLMCLQVELESPEYSIRRSDTALVKKDSFCFSATLLKRSSMRISQSVNQPQRREIKKAAKLF